MIELPDRIAPWRQTLGTLAPDLATALAPLVARLALAVGPLSSSNRSGVGDPDGYYGLARRGNYERLLATEWMLAKELPDEFLRRAGAGEHLFLQLASRVPAGGRRSVALFDAGPMQLGAPRIGHLAALIVLFQRAEHANTPFSWGILQQPDAALLDGVTQSTITTLLRARTAEAATEEHLQQWLAKLSLASTDEIWLIGDGTPTVENAAQLVVREPFEVDARRLIVSVHRRDGRANQVSLDLPPGDDCARLLRDPFSIITARPQPGSLLGSPPDSNPVFGQSGRRVIVRLRDGGIASLPIPNSPHSTPPAPALFRPDPDEEIIAVGSHGKRTSVVTLNAKKRTVRLGILGKRGGLGSDQLFGPISDEQELPAIGPSLGQCVRAGQPYNGADLVLYTDGKNRLFHFSRAVPPFWGLPIDALTMDGDKPAYIVTDSTVVYCGVRHWKADAFHVGATFRRNEAPAGGFLVFDRRHGRILLAFSNGDCWRTGTHPYSEDWATKDGWSMVDLYPGSNARVLGLTAGFAETALVLLDQDRRLISIAGRRTSRVVTRSTAEIMHAYVSSYGPEIAYVTVDGELVVSSIRTGETLLRFFPDGEK
jgi:hypothetical protein